MDSSLAAAASPPAAQTRALRAVWLGRIGYADALERQREAARLVGAGGAETLFLLEHEPVFTLGRNASPEDILWPEARRRVSGIEIHESDRGGKVTYHGPGQLVGYPVLKLSPDRRDVKRYVT
ncbi:MAG TPA: lipoate-protein ligase B, partial [Thermoanaerobaculia bacterium]